MKNNNINTMKRGSRSVVSTTLATAYIEHSFSIHSAYIGSRWQTGGKLLRLAAMMCLLFSLGVGNVWGTPTVLFHETFGNNTGSARAWNNTYSVKSGVSAVYSSASMAVTNAKQSKNTMGSTQSGLVSNQGATGSYVVGPLNASGYTSLGVSNYWGISASPWSASSSMKCYYSTNGSTYTEVSRTDSNGNPSTGVSSNSNYKQATYSLPVAAQVSTLYLKFEFYHYKLDKSSNQIGQAYLDEVELTGTAATPTPSLTADPTELDWGDDVLQGSSPSSQTVSISGSNLTSGSLTIGATGGYSVSPTSVDVDGTLSATTLTITPPSTATTGTKNGTLSISGGGLGSSVTVDLSMTVVEAHEVNWFVNGQSYTTGSPTQLVADGGTITVFPTNPSSCDDSKVFAGWSETNIGSTETNVEPTFVTPFTSISEPKDYYAVFAEESATSYVRITSDDDIYVGQKIAIVSNKQDYILQTNFNGTTAATHPNSDDSKLTVSASQKWTLEAVDEYGYFKLKNSTTQVGVNQTGGISSGSTAVGNYSTVASWWAIDLTTNYDYTVDDCFYMYNWATNTYYNFLENSGSAWLSYYAEDVTSGNKAWYAMKLYKPERSKFITTCCTDIDDINGSVSWNSPTEAVVTWDKLDSQVSSWALSWSPNTTGSSITSAIADKGSTQKTATVSGLACGTAYTFTLTPTIKSGVCTPASNPTIVSTSTKYAITLTDDGEVTGGLFTSDAEEACASDVIILEAAPNTGYAFSNWDIIYTDSGDDAWDDVNGDDDDLVSDEIVIEMPAADITVNAVFSCISTTVTVGPTTAAGNYGWRYTTGETIDLTCTASGATPTGYQWQKYIGSAWEDIDGATTARFQKASCTSSDGGSYRCVVTTGTGCSFVSDGGDGYFVRIFTLDGNYSGSDWTKNAITWTGEKTGTVTLNLNESSIYMFKVTDNDGKWFGNGTNNYIIQPVNWDCGTGNSNCRLFTGPEGNYTFTLDITNAGAGSPYVNVQVAYPSVTHPAEGYAYVSKWWTCYPHFWDGSGNALTPDGYDPELTTYTTICGDPYWYFPVLATYVNVIVKDNATYASAGNKSDNQTTTNHSGMYLTHDGSWGWHDFEKYTISFAGNGNSGGSMSDVSNICPDDNRTLAENGYTKTGYHFDGWKTNVAITINTGGEDTDIAANGIVADEATIKDISSDITLTAQWAANTNTPYLVKHYKQNLDGSYPSTPTETDELTGTSDASVTPARKSYTGFTAPAGTTTTISADGSLVVEYQYTRNSYTLTWSLDGGSISSAGTAAGSVKYGATLTAPTVTKTGYTFNAWSPAVPATMPAEAVTYTATWNAITYTITYEGLSGASNTNPTYYNIETPTITLADPGTRTGYTFDGWTCVGDEITQITIGSTGDKTITANWTINQYNVAVEAVAGVTITATPAGGSEISEGNNADLDYNKSVTLAYSGLETGIYWVGWKVTNAGGGDVTESVVSENTLTVPAYAVTVTAVLGKMKAWCMPEFEITGDVYLTSVPGVYVNLTSDAENLLTFSGTNTENVTKISIDYLDNNGDVVATKSSSPLRLRKGDNSGYAEDNITTGFSTGTYEGNFSVRFLPTAYEELDNYKLQLKIYKGTRVIKTVEHSMNGRALPEEFVIAIKNTNDGRWYAIPNTLASTQGAQDPIDLSSAVEISVDNTTSPTRATFAPSNALFKGTGRNTVGSNINGIRFTNDGSHWLQTSSSVNKLWLSNTNSDNDQVFYLKSSDFGAYELSMDPSQSPQKKIGLYNNSGVYLGYAKTPFSSDVYLLPVDINYFIGGVSGHEDEWSQTENWESGSLPTAGSIVRIMAPATIGAAETRHVAEVQIVTGGTTSHYKSGASECEGQLSIAAGGELIVTTTIKKCADASAFGTLTATTSSDLAIESNASHGLGGLVMGDHDGTNKATVYFATLSHGTSGSTASVSQYVGTPFCDESTISYDWYNSWVYGITYDGSGNIGWTRINGDQGMTPFKGYAVISADPAGHVYEMGGSLNPTANRTMDGLNWQSGTGTNPNNENLLANGWMAPIKIKAFKAEDFVKTDASIYIFNSGSPDDYDEIGASYGSGAGQYQTYSIGTAEATDVIPAMQSFSVYTNASGGSSVTLDYKRLVYDPAVEGTTPVPNRAPLATKNADEANKLKLFVKAESGYGDMLYMWEREDFTDYFENGWDARKVFGETTAPQLYAVTPDGNMAVNCVPTFEGVVMGFKAGDNENFYTFTFECDDEAEALYLVDTDNNAYTRVLSTNSYWFTTSDKEAHNRFILTHNAPGSTTGIDNTGNVQGTKAYKVIIHDKMYIIYGQEMYDATGKRVNEIK